MEEEGRGTKSQRPEDAVPGYPVEGESEEAQVEKFFALMKSIREMREQRYRAGSSVARKRPRVEASAWTPTFQLEDFAAAPSNRAAGIAAVSTEEGRRGKETTEEKETSLELKLSL